MQINDIFIYDNKEFYIYFTENKLIFHPKDLGVEAEGMSTACYRGYMSNYNIYKRRLILEDLYIWSKEYPIINGISASKPEKYKVFKRVYEKLNIDIRYTGSILIVGDCINVSTTFSKPIFPYYYKKIYELYFVDGKVLKAMEYSKVAEEIREYISNNKKSKEDFMERGIREHKFIMSCLSDEYKNKWVYNKCYYY